MKRFGQGSRQHAFQIAVSLVVIGLTAADDLQRFLAAIHMRDFAVDRFAGQLLVRQEVMSQAIDDAGRQFADVVPLAIHLVFGQHGDDFVVGLTAVNHSEAADGRSIHDDVAVCDLALGEYTNIKRIVVAHDVGSAGGLHAKFGYLRLAVGLRNKAVERRHDVGELLRAVYFQVAALFVHFVFYSIRGNYFDEGRHFSRRIRPDGDAVPGVRGVSQPDHFPQFAKGFLTHYSLVV